jgi:hypothetical protein
MIGARSVPSRMSMPAGQHPASFSASEHEDLALARTP